MAIFILLGRRVEREAKGTTIDEQINVLPNRRNRVKRDGKER
jgi:hypothetical protein